MERGLVQRVTGVKDEKTNKQYAIKIIDIENMSSEDIENIY
jgi:hypothetical protein